MTAIDGQTLFTTQHNECAARMGVTGALWPYESTMLLGAFFVTAALPCLHARVRKWM